MTSVEARYLDGSSVQVKNCQSIGDVMVHIANLHKRFASEVTVTCPASSKDLSDQPSQSPPCLVQVVLRLDETQSWDHEELLLTLCLHAQHGDIATCKRAFDILKASEPKCGYMLKAILDKADGDIADEAKVLRTLLCTGVGFKKNYLLKQACQSGDEKKVKMILSAGVPVEYEKEPEDVLGDRNSGSALTVAAFNGHANVVKVLLAHRADVNNVYSGVDGRFYGTPLMLASEEGHEDVVKILLSSRATVDLEVDNDWPLGIACKHRQAKVAEMLLAHQADVNYRTYFTSLGLAGLSKSLELTTMLLAHGASVNLVGGLNKVPLVYAQTPELQRSLLEHRAFVNFVSDDGETPLSIASKRKKVDHLEALLDHGAHIDRANHLDETALITATQARSVKVVRLLLARKANANYHTKEGKTALDYALDCGKKVLLELLQHHGALSRDNCASSANERAVLAASHFADDVLRLVKNIETRSLEVVRALQVMGENSCTEAQRQLELATRRFTDEVYLLSRIGPELSRFSNNYFTGTRKREIESCALVSAEKRQKSSIDEECLLENVAGEEKRELASDSGLSSEKKVTQSRK